MAWTRSSLVAFVWISVMWFTIHFHPLKIVKLNDQRVGYQLVFQTWIFKWLSFDPAIFVATFASVLSNSSDNQRLESNTLNITIEESLDIFKSPDVFQLMRVKIVLKYDLLSLLLLISLRYFTSLHCGVSQKRSARQGSCTEVCSRHNSITSVSGKLQESRRRDENDPRCEGLSLTICSKYFDIFWYMLIMCCMFFCETWFRRICTTAFIADGLYRPRTEVVQVLLTVTVTILVRNSLIQVQTSSNAIEFEHSSRPWSTNPWNYDDERAQLQTWRMSSSLLGILWLTASLSTQGSFQLRDICAKAYG